VSFQNVQHPSFCACPSLRCAAHDTIDKVYGRICTNVNYKFRIL
jgi:hypothetical protein